VRFDLRSRSPSSPRCVRRTIGVHTQLRTIDIDVHGEIERAVEALAPFCKATHSTHKSAPEVSRCRAVGLLAEPCTDLRAYKKAHSRLRERLYCWGYVRPDKDRGIKGDIDEGASDATRLGYAPMCQPGRAFRFLETEGNRLDVNRIRAPPRPAPRPPASMARSRNPDRYREASLRRAEEEIRSSLEGQRHEARFKEPASVARAELAFPHGEIRVLFRSQRFRRSARGDDSRSSARFEMAARRRSGQRRRVSSRRVPRSKRSLPHDRHIHPERQARHGRRLPPALRALSWVSAGRRVVRAPATASS
jgi:hypothetical protein